MRTQLLLKFEFEASHSLAEYEIAHPHIWRLFVAVEGNPIDGWVVDLVKLRARIQKVLDPIQNTYLNESSQVTYEVRQYPTCETLSQFFRHEIQDILKSDFLEKNPSIRLSEVGVAICGMDGVEMGAVRLILD